MAKKSKDKDEPVFDEVVSKPLTVEELEAFIATADEQGKRIGEILKLIFLNPETRMYVALVKVSNKMSEEIESFAETSILSNDKDDKIFERLNTLVKSLGEYSKNFLFARKAMMEMGITERKEQKTSGNKFADLATKFDGSRDTQQDES